MKNAQRLVLFPIIAAGITRGLALAAIIFWLTSGQFLNVSPAYFVSGAITIPVVVFGLAYWSWRFRFYCISKTSLSVTKGTFFKERVETSWEDIISVQRSQPMLHRVFGLYRVTCSTAATRNNQLVIEAVSPEVAAQIAKLQRNASGNSVPSQEKYEAPTLKTIYQISLSDYVAIALTYGQFFLIVLVVANIFANAGQLFILPSETALASWFVSLSITIQATTVLTVFVLGIAYGTLVAYLRFKSYTVVS